MSQSTDVDPDAESLRLAQQLEDEEFAAYREPALGFSEAELAEMDDETRQSIELAMRLQEEERLRIQEQQAAAERLEGQADDEESIALAIRLQQEDDESALRNRVTDGENVVQAVPVAAAQYVEGVPVHTGTSSSVRVVYRSRRGGWGSTERDVVVMAPTPLGAPPGGYWVRASYFGGATALCCCLWALLFWPVAFCVPLCPCDAEFLYRAPDGSLWYDSGQFAGYDDDY